VTDHLLHLDNHSGGEPEWRLECCHPPDAYEQQNEDGTTVFEPEYECRIRHVWDREGADILDIAGPILVLPIPVCPNNEWAWNWMLVRDDQVG